MKRVAATAVEKAQYKETRKATTYFVHVSFTVPGKKVRKKRTNNVPSATAANKKSRTEDDASFAKVSEPSLSARTTTAAARVSLSPIKGVSMPLLTKQANPEVARRALNAAVASGVSSATGEVDREMLQKALNCGYSVAFILSRVAKQRGDGDQKPAKK